MHPEAGLSLPALLYGQPIQTPPMGLPNQNTAHGPALIKRDPCAHIQMQPMGRSSSNKAHGLILTMSPMGPTWLIGPPPQIQQMGPWAFRVNRGPSTELLSNVTHWNPFAFAENYRTEIWAHR